MTISQMLSRFPLRIALTNYCNSNCFFCSNEGMPVAYKNNAHIDFDSLSWLIDLLTSEGLKNISLTGGEPSLYPQLTDLCLLLSKKKLDELFFHTNGILLEKDVINLLEKSGFTKIAVSVHSFDLNTWQSITRLPKKAFTKQTESLELLSKSKLFVEVKHVIINHLNDSEFQIKKTLQTCSILGIKPKFLNLEAIKEEQVNLKETIDITVDKIKALGGKNIHRKKTFRGQNKYLPVVHFDFENISGVAIDLLCGTKVGCNNCYFSNEMFLTPNLTLKPCHMSKTEYDLKPFIMSKDREGVLKIFREARLFLKTSPGLNKKFWEEK